MTTPLNNKKGTTLVELMVCLVLLALFGTAAVTLIRPCAEAYISVQQLTRAQNLADALTETIRGELADADGTITIVNAATGIADKNTVFAQGKRLTEGTALRFTVENNYAEVLDAGYVPRLYNNKAKNDKGDVFLYIPPQEAKATDQKKCPELQRYLHMRFYESNPDGSIKHERDSGTNSKIDCAYAYTTAYPNGDYMGLVVSDLKFYARGWERRTVTDAEGTKTEKVCLTSLSMVLTVAKPVTNADKTVTYTPVYTQTAVIPLPGSPEFQ